MWPRADGNLEGLDDECRWLNVTALKQRTGKQGSRWLGGVCHLSSREA